MASLSLLLSALLSTTTTPTEMNTQWLQDRETCMEQLHLTEVLLESPTFLVQWRECFNQLRKERTIQQQIERDLSRQLYIDSRRTRNSKQLESFKKNAAQKQFLRIRTTEDVRKTINTRVRPRSVRNY